MKIFIGFKNLTGENVTKAAQIKTGIIMLDNRKYYVYYTCMYLIYVFIYKRKASVSWGIKVLFYNN